MCFDLAQFLDVGKGKLDRILDQSADLELEIPEAALGQMLPVLAHGHFSIGPEVRRDVLSRNTFCCGARRFRVSSCMG